MTTDVPAGQDPETARHERAKTRAFLLTVLIGLILVVGAAAIITYAGAWAAVGVVLLLPGLGLLLGGGAGLMLRRRARRALAEHPWRRLTVDVPELPAGQRRGRLVVHPRGERDVRLGITGVRPAVLQSLEREGALWYAGDLERPGTVFVRLPDRSEVYLAVVSR